MNPLVDQAVVESNSDSALCDHCGLVVPKGLVRTDQPLQFCCPGCELAYRTIHACGLSEYYRLRDATTDARVKPHLRESPFVEFDDPAFHAIYVTVEDDGCATIELLLEDVHCAACVWLVERLPAVVEGVIEARLNLGRRLVVVRWMPDVVALSKIADSLNALGYRPHPAKGVSARQTQTLESRRMLVRIAVAGFCAGNVMLLSFALYGGAATSVESEYGHLFRWLAMAFAAVSVMGPGSLFFRGARAALRARSPHLDLPIAIALSAGGLWGVVNTVRGSGEVYFDSVTALVFLLLVGRFLQVRQQRSAADAIELLHAFTPSVAHLITDEGHRDVPVEALRIGDTLSVRAGETIPADGQITDGQSTLDSSLLTGESVPVETAIGDRVAAGAVNVTAPIEMVVEATGSETRVGRLMELVANATDRRAPLISLANRIAGVFTVVVVVLAIVCFFVSLRHGVEVAGERSIALMIVCCPCALGLATPLAMTAAIGRAARRGIMIKSSDAIEQLAHAGEMVLDKTGTVTTGRFTVVKVVGDPAAVTLAAALERHTSHPIATAITESAGESDGDDAIDNFEQIPGQGVRGTVRGRSVVVASPDYLREQGVAVGLDMSKAIENAIEQARTPVAVTVDGEVAAVLLLADEPRSDSRRCVERLRQRGWTVSLLSGDDASVTRRVAEAIGIDASNATGRASPEAKLAIIEGMDGRCVMVGDGVNDAAALAAADVGIAVHGGAEASLAAADVYLNHAGLSPVLDVLDLACSTRRVILTCLGVSLTYNAIAATLACMGFIGPIAAAILMPASSVVVLAIASQAGALGVRDKFPDSVHT